MGLNINKTNKFFRGVGRWIIRNRLLLLLLFALIIIVSALGLSKLREDSSYDSWYFEDDPIILLQNEFENTFGSTDICAVHIKVDDVFMRENLIQIRELSNELKEKVPFADEVLSITNFDYVSGTEYGIEVGDLIPEEIPYEAEKLNALREKAFDKKLLLNRLISADSTETWVVVQLKKLPKNWRTDPEYLDYIQRKAEENKDIYSEFNVKTPVAPDYMIGGVVKKIAGQEKYKGINPRTTGLPVMTYYDQVFYNSESPRLILIGLLISLILLFIFLRSLRGVVFPLFTILASMLVTMGIEGYLNVAVQTILLPIPLFLGLAIAVGYSIHIFNFYKRSLLKQGKRKEAVISAVEKTGWPLLFTSLTTISALMSFQFIGIRPLIWVGNTAAIIVGVTYLLIMLLFPICLSFGKDIEVKANTDLKNHKKLENFLVSYGKWTLKYYKVILLTFTTFTIIALAFTSKVEVNLNEGVVTGRQVPYIDRMYNIAESQIGSYSSYDVGIEFSNNDAAKEPENLKKLDMFVKDIEKLPLTKKTTSILNTLKDINQVLNEGNPEFYLIPESRQMVAQSLLLYENAGGDEVDQWVDYNYRKLHVRVEVVDSDAKQLVAEHSRIKELGEKYFPEANTIISGSLAMISDMSLKISWGQVVSFLISLLIIAILMMLVFGSVKVGLIGLIPNITPALVVGALMGFLNIPLDMLTATIMPMLMGLAVDDTIHFITHAQYEYQNSGDYDISIEKTFRTVGKALFMTSAVLVVNFLVFRTSIANLYRNCGLLVSAGIIAALLADYMITPICLKAFNAFGTNSKNVKEERSVS